MASWSPNDPAGRIILRWAEEAEKMGILLPGDPGWEEEYSPPSWPEPPKDYAYYGLAGEIVRAIEPHSEADPVALLTYLLVGFGNLIGRGPYYPVEADRHYTNLYAVLVGESAKGRKDSARGQILRLLRTIDPDWGDRAIIQGLSSGEGLIAAVRDEDEEEGGDGDGEVGGGIKDKRCLVIESEFAGPLKVMRREGNILSIILRTAWDQGDLQVLTRHNPLRATGAHISVVGHVTRDEILRHLTDTEAGNGFANRFLWVCARRSKFLPEGGNIAQVDFSPLLRRLTEAVRFARGVGEMKRDEGTRAYWAEIYPTLSEGKPGLLGAITNRAEAQVTRLSIIYALLDCSQVIRLEHLGAALALWEYCEKSAAYIFHDFFGDPLADEIVAYIRQRGEVTRTELYNQFRWRAAGRLDSLLRPLEAAGIITCEIFSPQSGGRPKRVYRYGGGGKRGSVQREGF